MLPFARLLLEEFGLAMLALLLLLLLLPLLLLELLLLLPSRAPSFSSFSLSRCSRSRFSRSRCSFSSSLSLLLPLFRVRRADSSHLGGFSLLSQELRLIEEPLARPRRRQQ